MRSLQSRPPAPGADAQQRLGAALLERLRPLADELALARQKPGLFSHAPQLFSYCCFQAERIARVRLPEPLIGVILRGEKEFWSGDDSRRYGPGTVFVFPAGLTFDVVNRPEARSGQYESLLVAPPRELCRDAGAPPPRAKAATLDLRVELGEELVEALAHAALGLRPSALVGELRLRRLAEVLLLLRDDPAARPLFAVSLGERVAWIVRGAPDHPWTAGEIGQGLHMGCSTLRRKLAAEGTSLREILAGVRMDVARRLLVSGDGNVSDAASAAGYASRSHFARRYRSVHGLTPRQHRAG